MPVHLQAEMVDLRAVLEATRVRVIKRVVRSKLTVGRRSFSKWTLLVALAATGPYACLRPRHGPQMHQLSRPVKSSINRMSKTNPNPPLG
jgi:hypothetical protein